MNMDLISWISGPLWVLYAWLAAEALRLALRRRTAAGGTADVWSRIGVFAARPWALWAVFNLYCRTRAKHGFGDPLTFPLYAKPWRPGQSAWATLTEWAAEPEFWIWSAAAGVLAGVCVAVGRAALRDERPGWARVAARLGWLWLLAFALWSAIACLPRGARVRSPTDPGSYLLVWHTTGGTFLYNMPHILSISRFLEDFEQIQPRLRHTIHGASHPPGAALSLYWIGKLTGADPTRIRENSEKLRYALGVTAVGALNVGAVFLLAWGLFRDTRIGLAAALLWLVSPAAGAYATFSQDIVYALFFHLALAGIWLVVTGPRRIGVAVGLGVVFFALTKLKYSWCIATSIFAVFAIVVGLRERWGRKDMFVRGLLPLAVMTVLSTAVLVTHRLDYLAIYRFSHDYHTEWYRFTGPYQWTLALLGGQLDMYLMMGALPAALCTGLLVRRRRLTAWSLPAVFALVVLAVYAIPVVFGPNPLKMETARCWMWILSVPIAFAAREIARTARPAAWLAGAVAAAAAAGYILRVFINFGA